MDTQIDFNKGNGLVPAIIQDAQTRSVLMLAYMNEEALAQTLDTGKVTFYSRSKSRLWTKGETSNNFLYYVSHRVDCDGDTLLITANPAGPVCHTGADTCFGEINSPSFTIHQLATVIDQRSGADPTESYTARLLNAGINKVAQKVGEEAVELVIEAKDANEELFVGEAADLLYHFLVLLKCKEIGLDKIEAELARRHH